MSDGLSSRTPRSYIDNATLAPLVRAHRRHRRRRVSDELGRALMQIAGGVWDRYHFTPERDDFVGDVCLHLLGTPLQRVDPKKNIFSYFTTCAIRFGIKLRKKVAAERRRFETYCEAIEFDGEQVPDDE